MDEFAAAVKERVAQALTDAGISQREVARRLFGKESDRTKVREWITTERTMPAEFVAWVALQTGVDGHYLLTGKRTPKEGREGAFDAIAAIVARVSSPRADVDPDRAERALREYLAALAGEPPGQSTG